MPEILAADAPALHLFAHPFSGYCWKVLIALWETDTTFVYRSIADPANAAEWQRLSVFCKMPRRARRCRSSAVPRLLPRRRAGPGLMPIGSRAAGLT